MSIRGNTVGTIMPRTNYNQTDPTKPDYLNGKTELDEKINSVKEIAENAVTKQEMENYVKDTFLGGEW